MKREMSLEFSEYVSHKNFAFIWYCFLFKDASTNELVAISYLLTKMKIL